MNINYSFLFKKLSFYIIISGLSLLVLSCNSFSDANDLESNSEKVMNNDLKENIIIKNIEIIPNDYCIAWSAIEEWTNENDGNNLRTKEGWNKRIKLTQNLIVSVPVQYQAIGFLYLEIVRDRAELLSEFNYVLLTEIPSNIKQSFIQEHFDDQQEANKLIDFFLSDC
jgi:hypothetical protein